MSKKPATAAVDATDLNSAVRALHDELKGLILTCAPSFPKVARGGLKFVSDIVDLQGQLATYNRQVLVRLFQSVTNGDTESTLRRASSFIRPWEGRRALAKEEDRSETEIDTTLRRQINVVRRKMLPFSEEALRRLNTDENVPEMLYYLSTVVQGLSWYADRYLARLSGELSKMET